MSTLPKATGTDPVEVEVTGNLSFGAVERVRETLLQAIPEQGDFRVVLREIDELDLAGVQLLYALCRTAASRNIRISVVPGDTAPRIEKLLRFAGLSPIPCVTS